MPQITVEYSPALSDAFDRHGFGHALHRLGAEIIPTDLASHKTRFRVADDAIIGDGAPSHAMVHVDFRLLAGRSETVRTELGRAVLALVRAHLQVLPGQDVQITVEISELNPTHYHKQTVTG